MHSLSDVSVPLCKPLCEVPLDSFPSLTMNVSNFFERSTKFIRGSKGTDLVLSVEMLTRNMIC